MNPSLGNEAGREMIHQQKQKLSLVRQMIKLILPLGKKKRKEKKISTSRNRNSVLVG